MPLCARPHLRWEGSWREGWRRPYHLASGSCGATHFARCARFVQTVRRKSDVRSALRARPPLRARPRDCAARRRRQRVAWPRSAHAAPAARASSVVFVTHASAIANTAAIGNVATTACRRAHRDDAGKGAGRPRVARLVRSREAQRQRRRAQRAPSITLAAIVRAQLAPASVASFAAPAGAASQGTPAQRGQAPKRPRRAARAFARAALGTREPAPAPAATRPRASGPVRVRRGRPGGRGVRTAGAASASAVPGTVRASR